MGQIISIHSFRGGTGKSNTVANIAAQLALAGKRVGIIDTDIQSPGIHVLFGLAGSRTTHSLNDYLDGRSTIGDAVHDVTARLATNTPGRLFLIPSSTQADEIASVLRGGYDVGLLIEGIRQLDEELALDTLLIDTHPGLDEETLSCIAISHTLVVMMRPDHQDYEGTGVTIEVARSLDIPNLSVVVNHVPAVFDHDEVRRRVRETCRVDDVTILPHCVEMMNLASSDVFSTVHPDHGLTQCYRNLAGKLDGRVQG